MPKTISHFTKMKKVLQVTALLLAGYITYGLLRPAPQYHPPKIEVAPDFETFYQRRLEISRKEKTRPGNEERLVRHARGKSEYAILYVHGFGASRAEGEYSVDRLATAIKANTYYLRLPGHGTNIEDHVARPFQEYLAVAEEALSHMPLLGNKVIVAGTSMGGMVSTWLAAQHPDKVYALILASPFYDYADPTAVILSWPGGIYLGELVVGKYRVKPGSRGENTRPGHDAYWYVPQYMRAVQNLQQLKVFASRDEIFQKINQPVLMLVYYRDEKHQDRSASVAAMKHAFTTFSTPKDKKKYVEIANGDHVLFSDWTKSDKELIHKTLVEFVKGL